MFSYIVANICTFFVFVDRSIYFILMHILAYSLPIGNDSSPSEDSPTKRGRRFFSGALWHEECDINANVTLEWLLLTTVLLSSWQTIVLIQSSANIREVPSTPNRIIAEGSSSDNTGTLCLRRCTMSLSHARDFISILWQPFFYSDSVHCWVTVAPSNGRKLNSEWHWSLVCVSCVFCYSPRRRLLYCQSW